MRPREFRQADCHYPNDRQKNMMYIKNTVKASNVHIGEFTYYDSHGKVDADFERDNILYNRPGHGDLIIGKFTSIAYGVEFIMGAANHSTKSFSSYPFNLISENWAGKLGMTKADMPVLGDTVIGNDVWIGRKTRIMPGVHIGDGAVIGSYSVVSKDIPPYAVAVGDPAKVVRIRFDEETISFLKRIQWWNFKPELIDAAIPYLTCVNVAFAAEQLEQLFQQNCKK